MRSPLVYLDNAATSFPKPESVYQAAEHYMRRVGGNPGRSAHRLSVAAARLVYGARESVSQVLGIENPDHLIFTANATDALNLAIVGLLKEGDHVLTSSMEHNSVMRPLRALVGEKGVELTVIACSKAGLLAVEDVSRAIQANTRLIAVVHASNVTGTLQPIAEIGELAREHGIAFLVDAAQTVGAYPVDVRRLGVDLMAFSGHKGLFGLQGTGGLYLGEGIDLKQIKWGGTGSASSLDVHPTFLPDKYESGTYNTVGLAGLGAGARFILEEGVDNIRLRERGLTQLLLDKLAAVEGVVLYGPLDADKQVGVVSFNVEGLEPSELGRVLDSVFGVMVRVGLQCAPHAHQTMGTFPDGTVRASVGYFNTEEEIAYLADCVEQIVDRTSRPEDSC